MKLKLCLISKYPPIEGGESSKAYWLAKALGEAGCEIHVVTNAWEVENCFRETIASTDLDSSYQPPNVFVHNTNPFVDPGFIPYSKPYTEKIASLAIDIIREYDLQLIDSWYILPYVISGFLAKTFTGKPQIMRHAGSDMGRLLPSAYLRTLFTSIFQNVDRIITYPSSMETFLKLGITEKQIFLNSKVSVDTRFFNPNVEPFDLSPYGQHDNKHIPVITYIGKVGRTKGIYELIEAARKIKDDFLLLFVSKGKGLDEFKEHVKRFGLMDKTLFLDFVPPWKMPSIIKRATCVVVPERDFPIIQHTPILPREVMAVGKCLILSNELYSKRRSVEIQDGKNVIVVNPRNIEEFRKSLDKVIKHPDYAENIGQQARLASEKIERFNEYINDTINLYRTVLER